MTKENLNQAILLFENGELIINKRIHRSFLLNNKWYPLRRIINKAKEIAGEKHDNTTDRDLVELAYLLPYVRLEKKMFETSFPVVMTESERLYEISHLSTILHDLSRHHS